MNNTLPRTTKTASKNVASLAKSELPLAELKRLMSAICQRGFHGTGTLIISLQDGHVQHVRVGTEKMVR